MRYAVKAAPPPGDAPNEYVMSDATVDRVGDVIEPAGWRLDNFNQHPIALFNHDRDQVIGKWTNVRVAKGKLVGTLDLAAPGTSVLVDTVRSLVDQKILRAVSVGFRPLKSEPIDAEDDGLWSPQRFLEQELLECSLVAVPANPNALSTAKSLNLPRDVMAALFCKPATEDAVHTRAITGKPAKHLAQNGANMLLSERIVAERKILNGLRDQLTALTTRDDLNEQEELLFETLPLQIEDAEKNLAKLEAAERALQAKTGQALPTAARIVVPPARKIAPHEHLYRAATTHFIAKVQGRSIDEVLRERYPGDEGTGAILKTAMAPANTTVAGWAAELAGIVLADYLNILARNAIYPKLAMKGPRFTFGRNGVIKVPARSNTPKINGSFVGEGAAIPVRKLGLTSITLTPKKMAVISEFTREMSLHSTPSIESVVRQAMDDDTAEAIDTVLIDNVAADTIRPAGLLNGLSGLTPSAATTTMDKIVQDIRTLMNPIVSARGGRDLCLIMNPAQQLAMSWVISIDGTFVFSSVENNTIRNITTIASTTVPAGELIMVDAADFASVTGDTPEFDVSDVATIHEEDTAPLPIVGGTTQPPAIGSVAAPVRSLWQTASIGVRMLLDMNWAMRRTGMVTFMTGVTW